MQSILKELGQVTAVIGAQWGDEGKGKITDILGQYFSIMARACSGANAGHTIVVNGQKYVFRLLPAGSLHQNVSIVLGAGMVIHLPTLLQEIAQLEQHGFPIIHRLKISAAAHVVLDAHQAMDAAIEEQRGSSSIGTTKRGIGPAYMDKAARRGLRIGDLDHPDCRTKLAATAAFMQKAFGVTMDIDTELRHIMDALRVIGSCVISDVSEELLCAHAKKQSIIIEGAQAALLDIDHGTYPYVTSSATTSAGALQGLGLPPMILNSCIGVAKAYCTRVGAGEFPSEDHGEAGERLRKRGGEFGSVTGRPRRCGWFSIPDVRRTARMNGCTMINLTKLDVLDTEHTIPVVSSVAKDGTANYTEFPGWNASTSGMKTWDSLPPNARHYIESIEREIGVPIRLIGTGPGRDDMIVRAA